MSPSDSFHAVELHWFSARTRVERLIGLGRVILAGTSVVALYLPPSEPAAAADLVHATLYAYLVWALVTLTWVLRTDVLPRSFGLAVHVLDLVFVTALQLFTGGASSPFFAYLMFAVVAAALRWRRRGAVWTGFVGLAVFLMNGVLPLLQHSAIDWNRLIIRTAYFAVVAALITYVSTHEERLRRHLARLAGWPGDRGEDLGTELARLLAYTAETLGAPRVAMVWEEREEPWVHLASWTSAGLDWTSEPPGSFSPVAPERLAGAAFLCFGADSPSPSVIYDPGADVRRWSGPPLSAGLVRRLQIRDVLSAPLDGETFAGRLFVLDKPGLSPDDLLIGEIAAHHVAAAVDRVYFVNHVRETVALQERARVAHELHDGVLQTLTGIEFKLTRLDSLLHRPDAVREWREELRHIVREEHAELRRFIRSLPTATPDAFDLERQLEALPARIAHHWELPVKIAVDRLPTLPASFGREAYLVIREAVVNAARHAGASQVAVDVDADGERVRIVVTDDGHGFQLEGRFEQDELKALAFAPASVHVRVERLGGTLVLESSSAGTRLEAQLPLR